MVLAIREKIHQSYGLDQCHEKVINLCQLHWKVVKCVGHLISQKPIYNGEKSRENKVDMYNFLV